jgi:PEGA domain-containing protein
VGAQDKGEADANLIAAAEAAASWARARRAAWTRAPVAAAPATPAREIARPAREPLPPIEFESPPAARPSPPPPVDSRDAERSFRTSAPSPAPPSGVAPPPAPPSGLAPPPAAPITLAPPIVFAPSSVPPAVEAPPPFVSAARHETGEGRSVSTGSAKTWLARIAIAAAVIGGAVVGWPFVSNMLTSKADTRGRRESANGGPTPDPTKLTGKLTIESTPSGAQVTVDGKARGVTPLTLNDVATGKHDVVLKSDAGTVRRTVTIAANQTETLDEQIFSGWVTVYSPFEVTIAEGSRVLRSDERNQVMLSPGIHELRLMNKALGYEAVLQVDVKPGAGTNVRLTPAPSSLTVSAPDTSEVLVDGVRAGDTPLNAFSVPLGTHEIVVRRANGAEKRYTITIGVKPYTLNAEF